MARTSLAEANRLQRDTLQLSQEARRIMATQTPRVLGSDPVATRDNLIELSSAVALTYGDLAATGAAEWYEQDRRRYVGGSYDALLATLNGDIIEGAARYAAQPLFDEAEAIFADLLFNSVEDFIHSAATETVAQNATRDQANGGWYRIPEPEACDYCLMLYDRGAVYSEDTVGFAMHDNCKCSIGSVWDGGGFEPSEEARRVSEYVDHLTPEQRQRKREDNRRYTEGWIERNKDRLEAMRSEL